MLAQLPKRRLLQRYRAGYHAVAVMQPASSGRVALKAHRVRQVEERLATGDRWQEQGMMFTTGIGTPLDPRNLERHFNALLVKAGLPKIRFHDLRHGCATLLLAQGVPITAISELLGHADTSITAQVYLHTLDTMRHEAADQMDRLLGHAG